MKMSKDSSARYCQNNKERTTKKVLWKIFKSFQRRKKQKCQYGQDQYKKLVEYGKKYYEMWKMITFHK